MNTATAPASDTATLGLSAYQRRQLDVDGFTVCRQVIDPAYLAELREEFDLVWARHGAGGRVFHQELLRSPAFIRLIDHPPIIAKHRDLFGDQVQLLSADLLRQGPRHPGKDYGWHRDFVFPGDHILSANTIVYLDDMTDESGPTRVVPGTHRGTANPHGEACQQPMAGEVAVYAQAGDAAIINAAVWHTGGCNRGPGLRRAIYLYYGWWWLKQYFAERGPMPWQAAVNASPARLALLGLRMPGPDLHQY